MDTRLLQFLALHCAYGVVAGVVFTIALIATDTLGIGTLVVEQDGGVLAGVVLGFLTCLSFGSLSMGWAIMLLRDR